MTRLYTKIKLCGNLQQAAQEDSPSTEQSKKSTTIWSEYSRKPDSNPWINHPQTARTSLVINIFPNFLLQLLT